MNISIEREKNRDRIEMSARVILNVKRRLAEYLTVKDISDYHCHRKTV